MITRAERRRTALQISRLTNLFIKEHPEMLEKYGIEKITDQITNDLLRLAFARLEGKE